MFERTPPGNPPWAPRTLSAACGLLLACGCSASGTVGYHFSIPKDQGQLADVKVVPGRYAGYDVLGRCLPIAWTQQRIVIRGQGPRRVVRWTPTGWGDAMVALRLRAQEALGFLAQAVWYEDSVCHQGDLALTAFVATYSQIDPAIERLGDLLRDEDLGDYAEAVVLGPGPDGHLTYDTKRWMPLASRPFYPYEISLTAGPRYQAPSRNKCHFRDAQAQGAISRQSPI
jgi:hypothetical protein